MPKAELQGESRIGENPTYGLVCEVKLKGFTLVELLIVVAIVALLAALILPGLSRAREYAYFTTCKSSQRQIGVGFLVFATNNKGSVKLIDNACDKYIGPDWGKIWGGGIGCKTGIKTNWWYGKGSWWGKFLACRIYGGIDDYHGTTGRDWFGVPKSEWVGKPRQPGAYLPIDILWDPILKVRPWGKWGHGSFPNGYDWGNGWQTIYSDTEKERDYMSRAVGVYGYEYFVRYVGCAKYRKNKSFVSHIIKASPYNGTQKSSYAEGPNHRPDTRNRSLRTFALPSAWVAACHTPLASRQMTSHFGATRARATVAGETFRFNVLHIDGHVHYDVWKEGYVNASSWLPGGPSWDYNNRPYGWWVKSPSGEGMLKTTPQFEGAFDQNKNEYREVSR